MDMSVWSAGVLALAVSVSAFAQPETKPVPSEFLRGNTLVVSDANFSVAAPSDDWHWEMLSGLPDEKSTSFVCIQNGSDARIVVVATHVAIQEINERFMRGFIKGVEKHVPDAAATMEYSKSETPRPGSMRYHYRTAAQYRYGYLVPTGRIVNIMGASATAEEPPALAAVANSLAIIDEAKAKPAEDSAPMVFFIEYGFCFIIGWLIGWVINYFAHRRIVNAAAIGCACMIPLFAFQIALLLRSDRLADASPEKQGELIGYLLGPALFAFFFTGAAAILEARRAAAVPVTRIR